MSTPCVPSEPSGPGEPIALVDAIRFELDGGEPQPVSYPALDALADTVQREARFCRVRIMVHATDPGYPRAQRLGQLRASAIRDYLVHRGIAHTRLEARGWDDARRPEDRRVEITGHEDGCPCPLQ